MEISSHCLFSCMNMEIIIIIQPTNQIQTKRTKIKFMEKKCRVILVLKFGFLEFLCHNVLFSCLFLVQQYEDLNSESQKNLLNTF